MATGRHDVVAPCRYSSSSHITLHWFKSSARDFLYPSWMTTTVASQYCRLTSSSFPNFPTAPSPTTMKISTAVSFAIAAAAVLAPQTVSSAALQAMGMTTTVIILSRHLEGLSEGGEVGSTVPAVLTTSTENKPEAETANVPAPSSEPVDQPPAPESVPKGDEPEPKPMDADEPVPAAEPVDDEDVPEPEDTGDLDDPEPVEYNEEFPVEDDATIGTEFDVDESANTEDLGEPEEYHSMDAVPEGEEAYQETPETKVFDDEPESFEHVNGVLLEEDEYEAVPYDEPVPDPEVIGAEDYVPPADDYESLSYEDPEPASEDLDAFDGPVEYTQYTEEAENFEDEEPEVLADAELEDRHRSLRRA